MSIAAGLDAQRAPKLWRALVVAALVPVVLFAISLWLTTRFDALLAQQNAVERAYQLQAAVEQVISQMKDAETGQRGYVLTGDRSFLRPYLAARTVVGVKLARLKAMTSGENAAIQSHVARIGDLVPHKFKEMQRILDIRERSGRDAAADAIAEGTGKRLMDRIRQETGAIERIQNAHLREQVAKADRDAQNGRRIFQIGMVIATGIALIVAITIWVTNRGRHRAMLNAINASTRQTAIFNNALNAIILINPSGSIEIMNPAAERLFGYPATDLLRRDIAVIADLAPGDGPFLDRIGLGEDGLAEPFRPLVRARRADGEPVPVEVALGLMPLEDGMHVVAVFSDVTERERVEQVKDQFLSTVSHELRTPLTSIVGSLGLLKAGIGDTLSPQAFRLVDIAEKNANRLIRIVNDLLDAEKLQSGQMTFAMAPLDMCDVITASANAMGGLAETKNIRIDVSCPAEIATVSGDNERLVQVVNNLISNAIKFSPNDTRIDVTLIRDGNLARVAVADQGPGIPESLRARLFSRFAQSPGAATSGIPGTGLGLAIARDILAAHDGRIAFADGAEGGTVFSFELPLWVDLSSEQALTGPPRLLVVADPAEAEKLSALFAAREVEADVVDSMGGLCAAVRKRRYLAVIVDFHFTGEKGMEAVQALRAEPFARHLPVIGITGDSRTVSEGDAGELDIVDWLPKPLVDERLDDAIAAAMKRATTAMPLVLHVDDDLDTLRITATALSGLAHVAQATDLASARAILAEKPVDIFIIDIALPDGSGLELVADVHSSGAAGTPIIIYSAQDAGSDFGDVEAVLIKSKKSLHSLVDIVLDIRTRQDREKAA